MDTEVSEVSKARAVYPVEFEAKRLKVTVIMIV